MPKNQLFFDIFWLLFAFITSLVIWNTNLLLETQFIPTVLNGVTTSISLIVGFTATTIAIMISKPFKPVENKYRIGFTTVMLATPIFILFVTYFELMNAEYQLALKYAMIGLIISFCTLVDFLTFLGSKLERME